MRDIEPMHVYAGCTMFNASIRCTMFKSMERYLLLQIFNATFDGNDASLLPVFILSTVISSSLGISLNISKR